MTTETLIKHSEAVQLMNREWEELEKSNGLQTLGRKKCYSCNPVLKSEGKEIIIFPESSNQENCPLCGRPLSETRCPA